MWLLTSFSFGKYAIIVEEHTLAKAFKNIFTMFEVYFFTSSYCIRCSNPSLGKLFVHCGWAVVVSTCVLKLNFPHFE